MVNSLNFENYKNPCNLHTTQGTEHIYHPRKLIIIPSHSNPSFIPRRFYTFPLIYSAFPFKPIFFMSIIHSHLEQKSSTLCVSKNLSVPLLKAFLWGLFKFCCCSVAKLVPSSSWPCGLQLARLLCPPQFSWSFLRFMFIESDAI